MPLHTPLIQWKDTAAPGLGGGGRSPVGMLLIGAIVALLGLIRELSRRI